MPCGLPYGLPGSARTFQGAFSPIWAKKRETALPALLIALTQPSDWRRPPSSLCFLSATPPLDAAAQG